jgi:hypothetical protein
MPTRWAKWFTKQGTSKVQRAWRAYPRLEGLETRDLLSVSPTFGSLVQVSSLSPFTNTSDISGQSGTVTLNSSVEPDIAVDPNNPMHMVAAWQQDRWSNGGSRGIVVGVTEDGGNTWSDEPLPGVTVNSGGTIQRASDPWVTIAPNGDVYVSCLPLNDPSVQSSYGVYVNKSTDGGFTWSNPTALIVNTNNNLENDKDSITADSTNSNYVYAVWDRLNSGAVSNQGPGPTLFSVTSNAGQTWSTPQDILDPSNGQTISNQIVVLPNDTLVNMCVDINYGTGANNIVVIRSTDHGATWSAPITVSSIDDIGVSDPNTGAGVRTGEIVPQIAVDHTNGNMYVVWQTGSLSSGAHNDIAFSMSTDGGLTWSTPIKANQTPTNISAGDQQAFTPAVAVAANGMVAVTYYDFRNNTGGPGLPTDYWIAFANPAQQTVSFGNEQRITNTSFNMELAPNAGGYFTGDYEALTNGGLSFNTFGAFFCQSVSTSNPTDAFFRGAFPPNTLALGQFSPPTGAVEGQSTGGTLATFTDSSPHPSVTDYTAVVTWGDGSTDTLTSASGGIVKNNNGSYSVVDNHTYAEESTSSMFSVQISDNAGGSAGSSATIQVQDAALTATPKTISTKEESAVSGVTVATFTDADPAGRISDYGATINWGDGDTTASVSIVADAHVPGQFDVIASKSHPYAVGGSYTVAVTITDAGGASIVADGTAVVADLALTATGRSVTSKEGATFTGIVATFKDADRTKAASFYSATINWGDNTASAGVVQATTTTGSFKVQGTHIYKESGPYSITVTINDPGGASITAKSSIAVADARLTNGAAAAIRIMHGQTFSGTVATFVDMNSFAPATDFTAMIHWGDGMTSMATVSMTSTGHFQVVGSHVYANAGTYSYSVSIVDDDGAALTINGKATIS